MDISIDVKKFLNKKVRYPQLLDVILNECVEYQIEICIISIYHKSIGDGVTAAKKSIH